jgi:hypothetical protein
LPRCNESGGDQFAIACQSPAFRRHLDGGGHAGSGLKAPRNQARPEAKKRNQKGRAASVTGSDGIDSNSVKLGLLTAVALSHHQR